MRLIIFLIILIPKLALAGVLFQDNFNTSADWSSPEQTNSASSCYPSTDCEIPGGWTGYYNGRCKCYDLDPDTTDIPGNRLLYINQYAGYPSETNACYGGTGKCLTYWDESCSAAENADGQISVDLGQEYSDLYLRFRVRFKTGYELGAIVGDQGPVRKIYHIQHYADGSPSAYFEGNRGNQPVTSGGFTEYGTAGPGGTGTQMFYAEFRCQQQYNCHTPATWFSLGSYADVYDGNWHTIEMRVLKNTSPGVADGKFELWWDGVKKNPVEAHAGRNEDIEWNDNTSVCESDTADPNGVCSNDGDCPGSTCDSTYEDRGFRYIFLAGNSNNQWDLSCSNMADCEQWYSIDDVVISTDPIGVDAIPTAAGVTFSGASFY